VGDTEDENSRGLLTCLSTALAITEEPMWRPSAVEGKLMGLRKISTVNSKTARRERPFTEEEPEQRGFSSLGCLGEGG
jgi:hypothetical protein